LKLRALIEVPRGSFLKRELHGVARLAFVSPLPCPFNYGCIPDLFGADGDPADAVVLGPRLPLGAVVEREVVARVRFVDGGRDDPKLVLSDRPLSALDRARLTAFFAFYARAKGLLARLRGREGGTGFLGIEEGDAG
jgi:inorganic pyrophosphatase